MTMCDGGGGARTSRSSRSSPTTKPAYSPRAWRAKTYWPPERGIIVPSSAIESAPSSAYSPPATQTPMKSHVDGQLRRHLAGRAQDARADGVADYDGEAEAHAQNIEQTAMASRFGRSFRLRDRKS